MRQAFLILTFLSIYSSTNGQTLVNPYFWNQTQTYNSPSTGALVDNNVQMSISTTSVEVSSGASKSSNLSRFISRKATNQSILNAKNHYYLAYQNSIHISPRKKITFGIQLYKTQTSVRTLQKSSGTGLTLNYHLLRFRNDIKEKHWSFGIQHNLIFRKPNSAAIDYAFHNLLDNYPVMSFNEFEAQFHNIGSEHNIGTSFINHKFKRSISHFGININSLKYKNLEHSNFNNPTIEFDNEFSNTARSIVGIQKTKNKKLSVEFNLITIFEFNVNGYEIESIMLKSINCGLGLGFKLGKENIGRVTYIFNADNYLENMSTICLSYEHSQYVYNFSFSNSSFGRYGTIAQLGVNCKLNNNSKPTLLRMNN